MDCHRDQIKESKQQIKLKKTNGQEKSLVNIQVIR